MKHADLGMGVVLLTLAFALAACDSANPTQSALPPGASATGGLLAGAGLVAGTIVDNVANAKSQEVAELRAGLVKAFGPSACNVSVFGSSASRGNDCRALVTLLSDRDTFANAALWTFVGAALLGAPTPVHAITARSPKTEVELHASRAVFHAGGGLLVQWTW